MHSQAKPGGENTPTRAPTLGSTLWLAEHNLPLPIHPTVDLYQSLTLKTQDIVLQLIITKKI